MMTESHKKPKPRDLTDSGFFGAATQIRTGDLILTKDVLYQLSHSSNSSENTFQDASYYSKKKRLCQVVLKKILRAFLSLFEREVKL